jgi:hypothetical protein
MCVRAPRLCRALIRSRMLTEEGKAEADRARESFTRRLASAEAVSAPADIDWATYKAALPDLDVDAIKRDFEKVVSSMPSGTYDEAADKAAHDTKEAAWAGFAAFCASRVKELKELQTAQDEHRLHRWYRRRRVWQR